MNIVSYRGPSSPGGVSGTLSVIFERYLSNEATWWHLADNDLLARARGADSLSLVSRIAPMIVAGHYRYCNNFLWPLMHELPQFAIFDEADYVDYRQFNLAVAGNIGGKTDIGSKYFVNDYQLSLLPQLFSTAENETTFFWHIPWPGVVPCEFTQQLAEIARSLLHSRKLGFHTQEYANNFLAFVQQNLAECSVDFGEMSIVCSDARRLREHTQLVVAPLGVDVEYWRKLSAVSSLHERTLLRGALGRNPFVLSVDRADYTKGVLERFSAISHFFDTNPSLVGEMTFLQICQRTRTGLPHFDQYWQSCLESATSINAKWATDSWTPILWITESCEPALLSSLYQRCSALLVTPLRDGLNLTAKEFVACSSERAGALVLSRQAGAWHELKSNCFDVDPFCKEQTSFQILQACSISSDEKRRRMNLLKQTLMSNSLGAWWKEFNSSSNQASHDRTASPLRRQRQILTSANCT